MSGHSILLNCARPKEKSCMKRRRCPLIHGWWKRRFRIPLHVRAFFKYVGQILPIKGQIKSEWIYEIINFPKNEPKNLKDFCPMYYKNSQGRNPSNFLVHFLEIDDFINSFWLNLIFSNHLPNPDWHRWRNSYTVLNWKSAYCFHCHLPPTYLVLST